MEFTNQTYKVAKRRAYQKVLDTAHILQWAKEHPAGDPDVARANYLKAVDTYWFIVARGHRLRGLFGREYLTILRVRNQEKIRKLMKTPNPDWTPYG